MQRSGITLRVLGDHRPPTAIDRMLRRRPAETRFDRCDFDGLDAVVGLVATPLLDRLARTRPDIPFLHVTDATPAFLRDAYGWAVPAEADATEARVASAAAACVFSSGLLAARAPRDLGTPDMVALSQPFGVNLDQRPDRHPEKPPLQRLNLLFVGIDWVRKGGDVAVATLGLLRARGIDAQLTIVGRCPDRHLNHPAIQAAGFLNKNRPKDAALLSRLYTEAHLLVLPSRADCTPMVIAEAMAHGTPVLATDVGGIGTQVGGSGAGDLMAPYAPPEAWADRIEDMTASQDRYNFLSDTAFDRAETRLNWAVWAERIETLVQQAVEVGRLPAPERGAKVALGAK